MYDARRRHELRREYDQMNNMNCHVEPLGLIVHTAHTHYTKQQYSDDFVFCHFFILIYIAFCYCFGSVGKIKFYYLFLYAYRCQREIRVNQTKKKSMH